MHKMSKPSGFQRARALLAYKDDPLQNIVYFKWFGFTSFAFSLDHTIPYHINGALGQYLDGESVCEHSVGADLLAFGGGS
jgi:hypothetical protein